MNQQNKERSSRQRERRHGALDRLLALPASPESSVMARREAEVKVLRERLNITVVGRQL